MNGAGAGRSFLRAVGLTSAFVAVGAPAGALVALASLAPIWFGAAGHRAAFVNSAVITVVALVGAACGMVVMPLFGWLLAGRASFWRIVIELTVGAIVGSTLAWVLTWSVQTDVLVIGAYIGALAALIRLRLTHKRGIDAP